MLKELSVSILAATTLFSAASGAVLAEPFQASAVEAKAVSQAASYVTANVSWNTVPGADYYRVAIRNLSTNTLIVNENRYNTSYFLSNLTRGTKYRFWVGAYTNNNVLIDHGETEERVYGGENIWIRIRK
ncbi:fibronectin type III domain-containing protein [Paenibacillus thiaminolyticus]|uniref:fibronectin type III domain-containing protein n=1 Tax=Paenibacillus thiaminolyticus TaxID=49283 RepID=UPI003D266B1C